MPTNKPIVLQLTRRIPATRERVFRAWTDPVELRKWWGPPGFTSPSAEIDLRVGGAYRIAMKPPEGDVFFVRGEFREVTPPERLVYTWSWDPAGASPGETLVTVELRERGRETELRLTHERFADEADRDRHDLGWNGCFDRLIEAVG